MLASKCLQVVQGSCDAGNIAMTVAIPYMINPDQVRVQEGGGRQPLFAPFSFISSCSQAYAREH